MKNHRRIGKALLYTIVLVLLFGLWLSVHSSPSPSGQAILGKNTRFSPRSDVWVYLGNDLTFTDPPIVDVRFGYANLSNVVWQIAPASGESVKVTNFQSFDKTKATTKFTANGTYTTYNWTWSPSHPYLKEAEGNLTGLEVEEFSSEVLSVTVGALTDSGSTLTFSCQGKTKPTRVKINGLEKAEGATWNYTQASNTLTVKTTHASDATISLDWNPGAGITTVTATRYTLKVLAEDDSGKTLHNAVVTVWEKQNPLGVVDSKKTDLYGFVSFSLAKGNYMVTGEYGDATNSTEVSVDGDKSVTLVIGVEEKPLVSLGPVRDFLGTPLYLTIMNYGGWILVIIGVILMIIGFSEDINWTKVLAIILCVGGSAMIINAFWGFIL